ncbi:MAG: RNA polymerase sigma factor RpoD/SigA [Gammaproteobacteria bacterium]|nr:RNA polymerase sigma factor RpoD/SigA [Gammaproteobacteria bacterium]
MSAEIEAGKEPSSFEEATTVLGDTWDQESADLMVDAEPISGSEKYGSIINRYRRTTRQRDLLTHDEELALGETIAEARTELTALVGQHRPSLECFLAALDRAELGQVPASDVTRSVFSATVASTGAKGAGRSQPWREHAVTLKKLMNKKGGGNVSEITTTLIQIDPAYPALRDALALLDSDSSRAGKGKLNVKARAGTSRYLEARRRLVESNLRLVFHFATKLIGRGLSYEDLVQEGILGLMRAADKYDYTLGFRFSTYASNWIQQALHRALANTSRQIRVPSDVHDFIVRLSKTSRSMAQTMGREPTPEELADTLGVEVRKVRQALRANHAAISLESPVGESESTDLKSLIVDTEQPSPDNVRGEAELQSEVALLLDELPLREAKILRLRYGIGLRYPMTLEQIGKSLGITRERTRQLERRALARLEDLIGSNESLI